MKAAVFYSSSRPIAIEQVDVRDPGPGEVRIKIMAAGLCHSDLSVIDGTIPYPVPVVLGHEGAGVIDAVGVGVRSVKEGDTVIVSTLSHCGRCAKCDAGHPTECKNAPSPKDAKPFTIKGVPAFQFANASVFAEYTVVREQGAIIIDPRVPFDRAALIGCGVMTGFGAVVNRAKVRPADDGGLRGRRHRPQLRAGRRSLRRRQDHRRRRHAAEARVGEALRRHARHRQLEGGSGRGGEGSHRRRR
jgi:S-(hydroxymethyl)glutathione dehydrogenase/alcohol dehydrogenase